ncbi:MAG: tetratricopeptide repeat protein [Saprospiraceae bacterium]|nr:tetratricopeptide repeat protein [Saprospiraceae bacterium]
MIRMHISLLLMALLGVTAACTSDAPADQTTTRPVSDIDQLTEAISAHPDDPSVYVDRARFHYARKNYGDAIQDMASAMRLDSINEGYHHLLADIYLAALRSQLALNTLERAVALFPQSKSSRLKLAEMQIILLQYPAASANIRRVLETNPRDVDALYLLGVMYREQDDLDNAIQSFQTVVEIDADHHEAWVMLGNLLDMRDDPMALQCFENAIAIDSTYPQGWHSKAFYLQNHGQVPEALEIYERIHRLDSTYLDAYLNAGILYLDQDNAAMAEEKFNRVIALNPDHPLGHYYLGITYESAGLDTQALTYLERAAALVPSSPRFASAVERVREKLQ